MKTAKERATEIANELRENINSHGKIDLSIFNKRPELVELTFTTGKKDRTVAFMDGKVCFADGVQPQETWMCEVIETKESFNVVRPVTMILSSEDNLRLFVALRNVVKYN